MPTPLTPVVFDQEQFDRERQEWEKLSLKNYSAVRALYGIEDDPQKQVVIANCMRITVQDGVPQEPVVADGSYKELNYNTSGYYYAPKMGKTVTEFYDYIEAIVAECRKQVEQKLIPGLSIGMSWPSPNEKHIPLQVTFSRWPPLERDSTLRATIYFDVSDYTE